MHTVIVLPTYNEAENIEPMVTALMALPVADLAVLVVDDSSPDGTGDLADQLAETYTGRVFVMHRKDKKGLGQAYIAGFQHAMAALGADVIIQMDCDFSHSPEYIPEMLEKLAEADVVVGSRYVRGGKVDERWEWGRYLLSWFANSVYTRVILWVKTNDTTAGFKAWKRETLEGLGLHRVTSNGYVFQVEMAYLTERLGYNVVEIPIYFEDRRIGQSKMDVPVKIEAALRTWSLRWKHQHLTPADRHTTHGQ